MTLHAVSLSLCPDMAVHIVQDQRDEPFLRPSPSSEFPC